MPKPVGPLTGLDERFAHMRLRIPAERNSALISPHTLADSDAEARSNGYGRRPGLSVLSCSLPCYAQCRSRHVSARLLALWQSN